MEYNVIPEHTSRKNVIVLLVLLVTAGLVLRAGYGCDRYLWLDEVQTIYNIEKGAQYLLSVNLQETITDVHPPLYPLLLLIWRHLFTSDFGLRFLSMLFGMLSFLFLYLVVREVSTQRTALIAVALSVFSVPHVHYSVEVRMYSLTLLLALANTWFFLKWTKDRRLRILIGYLVTAVASLYTYHFLVFVFLVQWIYIGVEFYHDRATLKNWFLINLLLLVCYIPGLYRLSAQLRFVSHGYWGVQPSLLELPGLFFWFVADSAWQFNRFFQLLIGSTWLVAFVIGWLSFKAGRTIKIVFSTWLFLPPLVIFALSSRSPLFQPRYFLFTIPVFYFFVSLGVQRIWATRFRWSFTPVFVITSLLSLLFFFNYPLRIDMKSVIETIDRNGRSPLPVFHIDDRGGNTETYIISRYYRPWATRECILGEYEQVSKEVLSIIGLSELCASVSEKLEPGEWCWVVYERSFLREADPLERLDQCLPDGYVPVETYHFYQVDLYLAAPRNSETTHRQQQGFRGHSAVRAGSVQTAEQPALTRRKTTC